MEKRGINRYIFLLFVCLSILCLLVFVINRKLLAAGVSDANLYYYSSGRKIELPLSRKMIAVRFKPKITSQQKRTIAESEKHLGMFSQRKDLLIYELTLLPMREGVTEENIVETISSLNGKSEVEFANPVFGFHDAELIFTDEFIVKFDPNMSEEQIEAFNAQNGVEIARKPEWTERYTLRVKDTKNMNTLRTANLYYESTITLFSLPNFIAWRKAWDVFPDDTYGPRPAPDGGEQWAKDVYFALHLYGKCSSF